MSDVGYFNSVSANLKTGVAQTEEIADGVKANSAAGVLPSMNALDTDIKAGTAISGLTEDFSDGITISRTTLLIGAGTPLDLSLPENTVPPSTADITKAVCEPYRNFMDEKRPIKIVQDIYDRLMSVYPPKKNPFLCEAPKPFIHFEHLFHVLEMLDSYHWVWRGICKNEAIFPIFAPFTKPDFDFDGSVLHSVLDNFVLRIMDIITQYNDYYNQKLPEHDWYRNFYLRFKAASDFFILNYDTTIEQTIEEYEDGYESDGIQDKFLRFNPHRLLNNPNGLSTINHLHGCINYYFSTYKDSNRDVYTFLSRDLYKYLDYATVRGLMVGRGQSSPANQSGETYKAAPIITGLRKLDKLNCIPFDFYHSNLVNCLIRNHKLIISGYSFGDSYCNQLIERMRYIHGERIRIVLIDKWNIPIEDRCHAGYWLKNELGMFLCKITMCSTFDSVIEELYKNENTSSGALISNNCNLMVFPNGFKHAAKHVDEIETFLNS